MSIIMPLTPIRKPAKKANKDIYFNKLYSLTGCEDLIDILKDLFTSMGSSQYQFSFATKMLHTKNTDRPIFDSKVRQYLSTEYGVKFRDPNYRRKAVRDVHLAKIDVFKHNWKELKDWYSSFLSPKNKESQILLDWFDKQFPSFATIDKVKKIDTLIIEWVTY